MRRPGGWKLELTDRLLAMLADAFEIVPLHRHAEAAERSPLPVRRRLPTV